MTTLELQFDLRRSDFHLDLQLQLPSRGVSALFGRSGCGKTTLLRCIAGLERAPRGRLLVAGEVWQDERHFLPVHRRGLGYVAQESGLFPHLDVRANLEFGLRRTPQAERHIAFDEALELLQLQTLLTRRPDQISGGQRQRVAIARALLAGPRLLLMDEPLASLDLDSKAEILPCLEAIHERLAIPVIYVSHAPDEVVRIADHLVLMEDGQIRAQGPLNTMLTRTDLPLAHLDEACAVIEGRVLEHDPEFHLSNVQVAGGRLITSRLDYPPGHSARLRIRARDVSLVRDPPTASSIINILPARITAIAAGADPARCLVQLALGPDLLLAQVTARSVHQLNLQVGDELYAQVKSVALMR